ncbi:MAG: hypothetical protein JNM13_04105 [Hyphomicrobiaceae bacterium]|nr:hypothetical protein [Hyphomicrobiaceae bacterium]
MIDYLRDLQADLKRFRTKLPKPKTKAVRGKQLLYEMQHMVDGYFRVCRPKMAEYGADDVDLRALDGEMHLILENSHKQVLASVHDRVLKAAIAATMPLEHTLVAANGPMDRSADLNPVDERILATLASIVPSARSAYAQAMVDLQQETRLSWRGPATDLREALRETLDHLAPDAAVKGAPNYAQEPGTNGPTMKQKVRYILSQRGRGSSQTAPAENAVKAVDELLGGFVRSVYTRSSVSTHTNSTRDEALKVRSFVRVALCELLEIHT